MKNISFVTKDCLCAVTFLLLIAVQSVEMDRGSSGFSYFKHIWTQPNRLTLKNDIIQEFKTAQIFRSFPLDDIYSRREGSIVKKPVEVRCDAYASKKIRYLRTVEFDGDSYNILNVLALPHSRIDVPVLGIDLVSLPGASVLAVDFHPMNLETGNENFNNAFYKAISPVHKHWSALLPLSQRDTLPEKMRQYFSPFVLYGRFPHDHSKGVSEEHKTLVDKASVAIYDYTRTYCRVLAEQLDADTLDPGFSETRRQCINEYLNYRTENDPAKNMLVAAFGKDWTETSIRDVFFPIEL